MISYCILSKEQNVVGFYRLSPSNRDNFMNREGMVIPSRLKREGMTIPSRLKRVGMTIPSRFKREGMGFPPLFMKSYFKKNDNPPIRTRESRGFPRDIPHASHSGCHSENPGFPSFLWEDYYILQWSATQTGEKWWGWFKRKYTGSIKIDLR